MDYTDCYPYYLGCHCSVFGENGLSFLRGISVNPEKVEVWYKGVMMVCHYDDITLILRPLEDISEKELNTIWAYFNWEPGFNLKRRKQILLESLYDQTFTYPELNFISQYLRRQGIDMDDLIKNGHAKSRRTKVRLLTEFL